MVTIKHPCPDCWKDMLVFDMWLRFYEDWQIIDWYDLTCEKCWVKKYLPRIAVYLNDYYRNEKERPCPECWNKLDIEFIKVDNDELSYFPLWYNLMCKKCWFKKYFKRDKNPLFCFESYQAKEKFYKRPNLPFIIKQYYLELED